MRDAMYKLHIFQKFGSVILLVLVTLDKGRATNGTLSGCQSSAAQVSTTLVFTPTTLTSVSPFVPHRLMSPGWSGIPTVLECAHLTVRGYPQARGYLYHKVTGSCTPLLWLESPTKPSAREVTAEEGTLYLSGICGNGFTLHEYGLVGDLACLRDSVSTATYKVATRTCASWGGHLASVKTSAKLDLIANISSGESRWIGLDDIDTEGQHIWQSDGSMLTSAEQEAVFGSFEPNNRNGAEDCVEFRRKTQKLNDLPCRYEIRYICEITLPSLDC
ncbi:hypothetical protein EGW08_002057 [Elysia chlorotica]|uniref:C-type lectin domain-containing protein n=1 Tax=Elysia chlorotica TaxID=188477 RepID=A0A3S1BW42_ELYCH|nr:hypothetical protein EGW08_002057 [Elysia chlorotica]